MEIAFIKFGYLLLTKSGKVAIFPNPVFDRKPTNFQALSKKKQYWIFVIFSCEMENFFSSKRGSQNNYHIPWGSSKEPLISCERNEYLGDFM